jgi:hypothetical protein
MNTAAHTTQIYEALTRLNLALRSAYQPDIREARAAAATMQMHLDRLMAELAEEERA